MSNQPRGSDSIDYDRDRLADDPEYRDRILNQIADTADVTGAATFDVTRWLLYVIGGLSLFAAGLYAGGRIGPRLAYYTTLTLTCFVIVPALAYLLYYRYES